MLTDTPDLTLPEEPPARGRQITRNVLTMRQTLMLAAWAHAHADDCRTLPNTKLAAMASAELEFPLTTPNIASALDALGIAKDKPKAPPTIEERVSLLEETVRLLTGFIQGIREGLESGHYSETTAPDAGQIARLTEEVNVLSSRVMRLEYPTAHGKPTDNPLFAELAEPVIITAD